MGVIKTEPLFQQIVERIPLEQKESFTPEQLEALRGAIAHLSWRRHVVDIRLSGLGVYLVVVGGQERRSLFHQKSCTVRPDQLFATQIPQGWGQRRGLRVF